MQDYSSLYFLDIKRGVSGIRNIHRLDKKTVWVTGATGLLGSCIVDLLMTLNEQYNADITVIASGRCINRLQSRFNRFLKDSHLLLHKMDLLDEISFPARKVDFVVHAAGNAHPMAFGTDPIGTLLGCISGTNQLLEYSRRNSVHKFLYVSSGEVYGVGDKKYSPFHEGFSGYVNPLEVRSCYPNGKRAAENLCVAYLAQYGLDVSIVRPCHIYGPYVSQSDNRATVQFCLNALKGEPILIKGSGSQTRSYLYVVDCCVAILTVLINGDVGQAYNIASDKPITIEGMANLIATMAGTTVVKKSEHHLGDTPITYQVLDATKLKMLGWREQFSILEGIEHTLKTMSSCYSGEL